MSTETKDQIGQDVKTAMRARDSQRLGVLRLITAAIKQCEVDERITVEDAQLLDILNKMVKQRLDSITQYQKADRQDLVEVEVYELELIRAYLPPQLGDDEIKAVIDAVITETGASSLKEMGKVMAQLKEKLSGRADMGAVSALVKSRLVP